MVGVLETGLVGRGEAGAATGPDDDDEDEVDTATPLPDFLADLLSSD